MMVSIQEPYDSVVRVLTKLQYRAVKHDLTGVHEAATEVIDLLTTDRKANKDAANAPKNQGGVMSKVNKTSNSVDFDTPKVNTPDNTIDRLTIKDWVEAAYLHGLCVENLDTGELEPPRDISEVQWIADKLEHKIAQEANKARLDELERLFARADGDRSARKYTGIVEGRIKILRDLTAEKGSK